MRLITVQGEGLVTQSPDTIELQLELTTLYKDYEKMMEEAINKIKLLSVHLTNIGFDKNDIQTSSLTINSKYEGMTDSSGKYINEFVGYEARQTVVLEFPMDTELLGETIGAITRSVTKPNVTIRFTIKDKKALVDAALKSAVSDAIRKATVLVDASGVKLGKIQTIDSRKYSDRIYSETQFMPTAMYGLKQIEIVPKDIELTEHVQISFEVL